MDEELERELQRFFREQQVAVLSAINSGEDVERAIDETDAALIALLLLYLPAHFRRGWEAAFADLDVDIPMLTRDENDARQRAREAVPMIQNTTLRGVLAQVEQAENEEALRSGVGMLFAGWQLHRAGMIATTEPVLAQRRGGTSFATQASLQQQLEKHWRDMGDDRVCVICRGNTNAGWLPMGVDFPNGNFTHPRCRCHVQYRKKTDEATA